MSLTIITCTTSTTDQDLANKSAISASDINGNSTSTSHQEEEASGHEGHDVEHQNIILPEGREVLVTVTEWLYTPSVINARVGEPLTIVLTNDGIIEHEVELPEFGFHLHTPAGASLKGSFVPNKSGTFEFACELPGHREAGMIGKLIVTE